MDPQADTVEADDAIISSDGSALLTAEENDDEFVLSTSPSSDTMDCDGTDFAAQLRKHRKQVLDKEAAATNNVFSDALRKHREQLVDTWEDNQSVDHNNTNADETNLNPNPNEAGKTVTILSTLDSPQNSKHDHGEVENDDSKSDDQFLDTTTAPSEGNLGIPTTAALSITTASSTESSDEIHIDVADAGAGADSSNDKKIKRQSNILPNDSNSIDDDNDDADSAFRSLEQNAELELNGEKAEEKYLDSDEAPQRRNDDSDDNDNDNDDVVEATKIIKDIGLDGFDQVVLQSAPDTDIIDEKKEQNDDLSDFGIVPTSLSHISVEENDDTPLQLSKDEEEEQNDESDDDFGDLEDVDKSSPEIQSDQIVLQSAPDTDIIDERKGPNDDLVDFDIAATSQSQISVEDNDDTPLQMSKDGEEEQNDESDDAFGDFEDVDTSASIVQSDRSNGAKERKENEEEENGYNDDNDEDDFGEFEDVDTPAPKLQPDQPNDAEERKEYEEKVDNDGDKDESDFGDFDTPAPKIQLIDAEERKENVEEVGNDRGDDDDDDNDENDFGDFEDDDTSAPKFQSEIPNNDDAAPVEDNDDAFGEFDTAARSLESEQPKVVEENDDSGEFDAAPVEDNDDDDFGEFDAAAPSLETEQFKVVEENDELGKFDAAPVEDNDDDDDDDDFGEFDTAAQSLETEQTKVVEENDNFGEFDAAPVEDNDDDDDDDDDDNFGEFDTAAPSLEIEQPKVVEDNGGRFDAAPVEENDDDDDDDDDDFGEFDTAAPSLEKEQPKVIEEDEEDNSFGRFDAAPVEDNDDDDDDDADDFGEFDTAAPSLEIEQTKVVEEDEEDNSFGRFDAAPVEDDDDDDDDDDFGEFDTAAPSLEIEQPKVVEGNEVDDDFGRFDAAPIEGNNDDDDDFGEFDTAAPSLKSEQPKVVEENEEVDDDFGKFDTAPVVEENDGDNFGDFGEFDAAPTLQPMVVKDSPTPLAPVGRINDKTRNIFAKMQALYSFLDSNDDRSDVGGSELLPKASVELFLASLKATQQIEEGVLEHNCLDRQLKGATISREENSTLIINDDGRGPFHCFRYPLAGLHAPHTDFDNKRQRRKSSMRARVPDVLPIQLPTGKEMPLETSSPVTGRRRKINTSTPVSVESTPFPDLSVSNEIDDEISSVENKSFEIVQRLKSKIPDLSFMNRSELKFPKN